MKWKRWKKILSSLDRLEFATLKHLQRLHDLKSYDNAYRILREMEQEGLVLTEKREHKIYYLSKDGKIMIGSEKEFPPKRLIEHTLMRNDFYLFLDCPPSWEIERPVRTSAFEIIPDVTFKDRNGIPIFVEIDNKMSMRDNRKKINNYKNLSPFFKKQFGKSLEVYFLTVTENRKKLLESYAKNKINVKVYSIFDIN